MSTGLNLLPFPRQLTQEAEFFGVKQQKFIQLDSPDPEKLIFSGSRLKHNLSGFNSWELTASKLLPHEAVGIILRLAPDVVPNLEGYQLTIKPEQITIEGHDEAGIFHGVCTLIQIAGQSSPTSIPCLQIVDWPDFPARGVMLDISRDKVPTLDTLFALVDLLASWKYNQFQLYTEHTFAYQQHPEVWKKASPVTAEEILALDQYCHERYVELVPNQNSFGHMHRWFEHERYYPLGELAGVTLKNWWGKGSFSLCPLDTGSIQLVGSLYEELLPNFSSKLFNVGCDETFDLGLGRSKSECERIGKGRVYFDFLQKIHNLVDSHGRTMQFWGDIIMQHPELVPELPKNIIALEWGYDEASPPAEHCEKFAQAGIPFYVCPGTSSWNSIAGMTDRTLSNTSLAARNGKAFGAIGYLNTDWGDNGHWQALSASYLGYASGAAFSWCFQSNQEIDIQSALSLHAFRDASNVLGQLAYALGNVYKALGTPIEYESALFYTMQEPIEALNKRKNQIHPERFKAMLDFLHQSSQDLVRSQPTSPDAGLVLREYNQAIQLLTHACQRGLFASGDKSTSASKLDVNLRELMIEFQSIWLSRNRVGGLVDSLSRFEASRQDYLK